MATNDYKAGERVLVPAAKNPNEPTPVTTVSIQPTEIEDLQARLDEAYRTDHLTLPAPPPPVNLERAAISDAERKVILNPNADGDTVVDDKGTTLAQLREQIQLGVLPDDAPQEAHDSIGKHSIEVSTDEEGSQIVVITPPNSNDREVVISEPKVQEGAVPYGSELMHSTTPVPQAEIGMSDEMKERELEAIRHGQSTYAATSVPTEKPASSPNDVPIDENTSS